MLESVLSSWYETNSVPFLSALILGLMTAISPCPLALNITAMGFVSKDVEDKHLIFKKGIIYTLGRALSYTVLGLALYFGADTFRLSSLFQEYGEKFIGPILLITGLFMLGILTLKIGVFGRWTEAWQTKSKHRLWDVFLIGVVFALAFCPYSAVLYFGMLIPLTLQSASGLYLPLVFAIATGIPVILFAWLLAYSVSGVGQFYNRIRAFELWFRRLVAVLFIGVGVYYLIAVTL